jgi:ribosome-associated protein
MRRIPITDTISLGEEELEESFVLASGPGGQNVNKVASAVQLRFDTVHSPSLPEALRARLLRLAGARATKQGIIVIAARTYRSRERNREDARARLFALIRRAATSPKTRRPTRPSRAAKERRLEDKAARARVKRARKPVQPE